MARNVVSRRKARQGGQELIEFTLLLFPILGFLFLTIDVAWMVTTRAQLQYGVRQGSRWAIANGNNYALPANLVTAVQSVVKRNVLFQSLNGHDDLIVVTFYAPTDLTTPLALTGISPPASSPGNVVQVAVESYQAKSLLGVFHSLTPFSFSARSLDVMQ